jgi:hypothetical protein
MTDTAVPTKCGPRRRLIAECRVGEHKRRRASLRRRRPCRGEKAASKKRRFANGKEESSDASGRCRFTRRSRFTAVR